jgi:CRP-like cAMP-binding protein
LEDDKAKALLRIIEKVPIFNNMGADNVRTILQLCERRTVQPWDTLCRVREQSTDMAILLSGQLGVFSAENRQVSTVQPVALVGEVDLITGQPRTATVRAIQQSSLLVLGKTAFDRLMRSNAAICLCVYRNVGSTMVGRYAETEVQGRALSKELSASDEELHRLHEEIEALRSGQVE